MRNVLIKNIKNLVLFIVTYTEEDKILHKKAILNWINTFEIFQEKSIIYNVEANPYRIIVKIIDSENNEFIWNFLVAVPIHRVGTNNPWELSEDWKNSLIIQMKNNLSFASTIRDVKSKYIISKNNEFYSIAANPFASYEGHDFYPTVLEKASIILYTIVKDHPFYDGNKRTSLLTCISFLNSCGFDLLKIDTIEIVERVKDFMIFVANSLSEEKQEIIEKIKDFILENITINVDYQIWMSSKYSIDKVTNLIEHID